MKTLFFAASLLALTGAAGAQDRPKYESWPELKGEYLGQTPPGTEPVLFAPGLVSTEDGFELNAVFSPDGRIFMFSREVNGIYKMFFSFLRSDGTWTEPQMAGPSKTYPGHKDVDMVFSADKKWLYFISDRPLKGYSLSRYNIWRSKIGDFGLESPEPLGEHINGPGHELYPMLVADGSLYYSVVREGSLGGGDIYRAQYTNGQFEQPINLGPAINSESGEGDVFVNPDESMLVVVSGGREGGYGDGDLYISFKQSDGSWSQTKNMGPTFNTTQTDYCPMLSHDGKYFFFSRGGDVYWVDSKALEQFKE